MKSKSTPEMAPAVPLFRTTPSLSVRPLKLPEKISRPVTARTPSELTVNP
jgi:hypothetical protein